MEKLNKRSEQVERALRNFATASSAAEVLKSENTKASVDAHKKLYESKKKAVAAVDKKKRAQESLNKVLRKAKDESQVDDEETTDSDTSSEESDSGEPAPATPSFGGAVSAA